MVIGTTPEDQRVNIFPRILSVSFLVSTPWCYLAFGYCLSCREEENGSSTVDRPVKELTSELMHLYDVIQEEAPGGSTANEEEATSRML